MSLDKETKFEIFAGVVSVVLSYVAYKLRIKHIELDKLKGTLGIKHTELDKLKITLEQNLNLSEPLSNKNNKAHQMVSYMMPYSYVGQSHELADFFVKLRHDGKFEIRAPSSHKLIQNHLYSELFSKHETVLFLV